MKKLYYLLTVFLLAVILTGCGKKDDGLEEYRAEMSSFTDTINELVSSIESIDLESETRTEELLGYLDEMDAAFTAMGNLEVPEQFANIEELADEASANLSKSVSLYHQAFDNPENYDPQLIEAALEYYSRALRLSMRMTIHLPKPHPRKTKVIPDPKRKIQNRKKTPVLKAPKAMKHPKNLRSNKQQKARFGIFYYHEERQQKDAEFIVPRPCMYNIRFSIYSIILSCSVTFRTVSGRDSPALSISPVCPVSSTIGIIMDKYNASNHSPFMHCTSLISVKYSRSMTIFPAVLRERELVFRLPFDIIKNTRIPCQNCVQFIKEKLNSIRKL